MHLDISIIIRIISIIIRIIKDMIYIIIATIKKKTFNHKWSNKTYSRGPDGWSNKLTNKHNLQNRSQRNYSQNSVSQHHNKIRQLEHRFFTNRAANESIRIKLTPV